MQNTATTILEELEVEYDENITFPRLLKETMSELGLSANNQDKDTQAGKIASQLLGNLGAVPQKMAELRNEYGDGHTRNINS